MKSTGMTRPFDGLGRIVIPKEIRRNLGVTEGTPMEIYVDDGSVVLKRYAPGCQFCDNTDGVKMVGGVRICRQCAEEMAEKYGEAES